MTHHSYIVAVLYLWIVTTASIVQSRKASLVDLSMRKNHEQSNIPSFVEHIKRVRRSASHGKQDTTGNREIFRIASQMKDHNATSGEMVQFKCKVEASSDSNITYSWYNEDMLLDPLYHNRVLITQRPWGSRLRIKVVYTTDSGLYRCEAFNGVKRIHTSSHLAVSFELPPPLSDHEKPKIEIPNGKCETYRGFACGDYLQGMEIYVDSFQVQQDMEKQITSALSQISDTRYVSRKCQRFAVPAFCYFVFPPCHVDRDGASTRGGKLCREDCELLKRDICNREYLQRENNPFMKEIFNSANCSHLPSAEDSECTRVGLPTFESEEECYHDHGEDYEGEVNVAASGLTCRPWPSHMVDEYPSLIGGRNYCRNPGGLEEKPWCFVNRGRTRKGLCNIAKCETKEGSNLLFIIIPCACAVVLIFAVLLIYYLYCRRNRDVTTRDKPTPNLQLKTPLLSSQAKVPQINASSLRIVTEIGKGEYGKVFKAVIVNDARFSNNQPVAIKTLQESHVMTHLEPFMREMEILSGLSHPNITCLKAVTVQPNFRSMVFDYTDQVDLHEYLVLNSPHADVIKHVTNSVDGLASPNIDNTDFTRMAAQVASGMEYLTSNNFIHRDLSARNVLVCGNMDLKICNLGVVRDSYLSSYYRSPHGVQMLPIRWMAPESLQSWQFSDKSTVWSFGVLLWEMFSYGLQPYCGYSNHEVLEMISRRQILTCPDQCPAKMYSLMHECWAALPQQRPSFAEMLTKLNAWKDDVPTLIVKKLPINSNLEIPMNAPSPPPEYTSQPSVYGPSWHPPRSTSERSYPSSGEASMKLIASSGNSRASSSRDDFRPIIPHHLAARRPSQGFDSSHVPTDTMNVMTIHCGPGLQDVRHHNTTRISHNAATGQVIPRDDAVVRDENQYT